MAAFLPCGEVERRPRCRRTEATLVPSPPRTNSDSDQPASGKLRAAGGRCGPRAFLAKASSGAAGLEVSARPRGAALGGVLLVRGEEVDLHQREQVPAFLPQVRVVLLPERNQAPEVHQLDVLVRGAGLALGIGRETARGD